MAKEDRKNHRSFEEIAAERDEVSEEIDGLEQELGDIEEFSAETAIKYGMKYQILTQRFYVLDVDITRREGELEYVDSLEALQYVNFRVNEAREGNYASVKADLKYSGQIAMSNSRGEPKMLIRGTAFLKIAEAMPERAAPFTDDMLI